LAKHAPCPLQWMASVPGGGFCAASLRGRGVQNLWHITPNQGHSSFTASSPSPAVLTSPTLSWQHLQRWEPAHAPCPLHFLSSMPP